MSIFLHMWKSCRLLVEGKHKKQPKEKLKSPDSDDESHIQSLERIRRNKALPERRSVQLPPLFPPVSRDIDSVNDKKKKRNKQISDVQCRLPPLDNATMSKIVRHDETTLSDLKHMSASKNHREGHSKRKKRHKKRDNVLDGDFEIGAQIGKNLNENLTSNIHRKNLSIDELKSATEMYEFHRDELPNVQEQIIDKAKIMNPDGATYEGCDRSQLTLRCAEKNRSQRQHDRNKSDINRKPTRLVPLNVSLQASKLQHAEFGNSNPLPFIKHDDVAERKNGQTRSGVNELSHNGRCTMEESVKNDHESRTRARENAEAEHKSVFELRKHVCEDDKELMNELRLDLSFLHPKKTAKKPSETEVMDISLRDSNSESGENEYLKADVDSADEQFDENQSLCMTEVDNRVTETTDSDALYEDLFEDDDIPIMASVSPTPERCFLLKPR